MAPGAGTNFLKCYLFFLNMKVTSFGGGLYHMVEDIKAYLERHFYRFLWTPVDLFVLFSKHNLCIVYWPKKGFITSVLKFGLC